MVTVVADHIAGKSGGDPQRQDNFSVVLQGLSSKLELWVSGATFPGYTAELGQIRAVNLLRKYVTGVTFDDVRITVVDCVDLDLARELDTWWKRISPDGGKTINLATQYKSEGVLFWTDSCGKTERAWRLLGCFPSSLRFGVGQMASAGPVEIEMTLSVDQAIRRD